MAAIKILPRSILMKERAMLNLIIAVGRMDFEMAMAENFLEIACNYDKAGARNLLIFTINRCIWFRAEALLSWMHFFYRGAIDTLREALLEIFLGRV